MGHTHKQDESRKGEIGTGRRLVGVVMGEYHQNTLYTHI